MPRTGTPRPGIGSRLWLALGLGAAVSAALSGCQSVGYVAHVGAGQLRMLWDRQTLAPDTIESLDPAERRGLRAIERAKAFAVELGLRPSSSYRHLIERDRDTAVRVVVASPPDRLEAITWWFPIVGSVAYRGYFDPERARSFARRLEDEGLDTYVRPALLYSTLGYFDDPIPRGILRWPEIDLCDVILHELVHGTIFVSGDVPYNEALASFVAEEGTLRMLADAPEQRREAEALYADRARYAALIESLAEELETLFTSEPDPSSARSARREIFDRYQHEIYPELGFETPRYAWFTEAELNNAFVVAQRTYSGYVPCLREELDRHGGDLRALVRAHRERPGRRAEGCPATP